ncbi:MAG: DNA methyltransferase [bacterium]
MTNKSTQVNNLSETRQTFETKAHIFACTRKSEKECLEKMLFATSKIYEEKVYQVKKGDHLFLLNLDTDVLYGVFIAETDGSENLDSNAFGGRYPFQVKVRIKGELKKINKSKVILSRMGINWHEPLNGNQTEWLLNYFADSVNFNWEKVTTEKQELNEKPVLEATTLWDYPRQSYGKTPKGDNKYPGVTPAFIIYNMIKRYTKPGDLVVDPMAGSGTTLDVCKEEGRRCIAYDIAPTRPDIIQNDARSIPLPDNSVDMVFIDSPYGDNVKYNDHPLDIGKISAESEQFYEELEKVMAECHRILKEGKILGWLIGDQWVKKKFTPVGFKIYERLCKYFEPVDIICVVRRGQTSNTGIWYNRAIRFNFYLRGFKYLLLMRKSSDKDFKKEERKIIWTHYERKK